MRGQQQEHEDDREAERNRRRVAGGFLLQRDLGPFEAEAGRKIGEDPLHGPDGLAG